MAKITDGAFRRLLGVGTLGPYLIVCAIICCMPFFLLCKYVYPINDDFSFALQHMGTNCFQSVVEGWNAWSGRYFATFISSLNPFVISEGPLELFRCFSAGVIALFVVGLMAFPVLAARGILPFKNALGVGALFLLIYLTLFPSVSQAFYWFSSYTAYTIPSLMFLGLLALSCRRGRLSFITGCILALLTPGGNEVTAVITVCALAYLSMTYRRCRLYVFTILSMIGIIVVILSPGNGIRMEHQLSAHPYLWTVLVSSFQTISWLFLWGPVLLLATLLYIPLGGRVVARLPVFNVKFRWYLTALFVTVLLAHVPPTLGLSSVMIDRTANCLLMFVIPAYFYGINILSHKYPRVADKICGIISVKGGAVAMTFCFVFIGPLTIDSPVSTAVTDIVSHKAADYAQVQARRIELAKNTEEGDVIELPPLGLTSFSLFVKELDENPDDEFSSNFCKIYGCKGKVFVKSDDVRFEDNLSSMKNLSKRKRGGQE